MRRHGTMKHVLPAVLLLATSACAHHDAPPPAPASPPPARQPLGDFFVTSLGTAPGWVVAEDKEGFYCRFFQYSGTGDYGERFGGALDALKEQGKKSGANAFVNVTVSSESHEIQGSKWHSSYVHICGDFVTLR